MYIVRLTEGTNELHTFCTFTQKKDIKFLN